MAAAAVLTGARSMTAIAEWAADTPQPVRAALGACRDAPDRWVVPAEATIRRTLARVDPTALAAVIGAWLADRDRPGQQHRRRAVAVDGKTLRGARRDGRQVHLLAAMDHATRAVLAQRQVNGAAGEVHGFAPLLARSCRTAHPCRSRGESRRAVRRSPAAPRRPSDGVWAGLEPQPPASCHGRERANHQAEPEYQQAAKDSPTDADADADGGGDPPSEGPGPCSPSGRPQPPPPPPRAETPGWPTLAPHPPLGPLPV